MTERGSGPLVLKVGGALLRYPDSLIETLALIDAAAQRRPILLVPGGGLFADAVRHVDRSIGLSDDTAHWMAILGMDQYAFVLAGRLERGLVVRTREDISASMGDGVPVMAPFDWLRRIDPLPHSWDVTSDSIAAWLAGEVDASQLLLIKPPDAVDPLVDSYFTRALPAGMRSTIVVAGPPLRSALEAC